MEVDHDVLDVEVGFNEFDDNDQVSDQNKYGQEIMEIEVEPDNHHLKESTKEQHDLRDKLIENKKRESGSVEESVSANSVEENKDSSKLKVRKHDYNYQRKSKNQDLRHSHNVLYKELHASADLDPGILGREIAYRLGEAKVGLIANVVRILGFKPAMKILEETRMIERRGGMLTTDQSRRRTPGGIFIYCLKEKGYASKEEVELIFKDEKERLKEAAKRKKKAQNLKKRKELQKSDRLKKRVLEFVNKKIAGDAEKVNDETMVQEGEIVKVTDKGSVEELLAENINNNLESLTQDSLGKI